MELGQVALDVAVRDHDVVRIRLPGGCVILEAVASNSSGQAHVLCMKSYSLCMDTAEIGVFKETSEVSLRGLLNSDEGLGLESDLVVDACSNLTDDSLEGCSR